MKSFSPAMGRGARIIIVGALCAVLAPPAASADASQIRPPEVLESVEAVYPPEARREGREASVVLQLDIDADGRVTNAVVTGSGGAEFDAAAIEAVTRFRFRPAEIERVPTAVRIEYRYHFELRSEPPPPVATGMVRGTLLERGTRAPLPDALVRATRGGEEHETITDAAGHFELRELPPGPWQLQVSAAEHEPVGLEAVADANADELTIRVQRTSRGQEVTVRAHRAPGEIAQRTVSREELQKAPGTYGDAIRVIQDLPGVARTPLGLGPLIVRGGRAGDTRTYVDGQYVPLLFHFAGGPSVINSDLVDSLEFHPGNAPVRFGRSIAGAVDVTTREGRRDRVHGAAQVDLLAASLFVEGPLGASGSFMASARRSHADAVLPLILPLVGGSAFQLAPRYWDYQLKADFAAGRNAFSVFLFGSDDMLSLLMNDPNAVGIEQRSSLQTGLSFTRLTARWKRPLVGTLTHRLSVTAGLDSSFTNYGGDISGKLDFQSIAVREDLSLHPFETLFVDGGLDLYLARFAYEVQAPPLPTPGQLYDPLLGDNLMRATDRGVLGQPGAFVQARWKPVRTLELVPGLRFDADAYLQRHWWDPRITALLHVAPAVTVKGAAGLFHQPPSPERLAQAFGNPALREEGAAHVGIGAEWLASERLGLDLQFYYKNMFDETVLTSPATGARATYANSGEGRSLGMELLVRRAPGSGLSGWISLSVAHTERRDGPGKGWATSDFDQRFNLTAVAAYPLPKDFQLGARVRWTDGNPTTPVAGAVYDSDADSYLPLPATTSSRLPAFFQLDLRLDRRFTFDRWLLDAYLDVQNVTNRHNAEGVQHSFDYTRAAPLMGLPIFPSLGVRGEL